MNEHNTHLTTEQQFLAETPKTTRAVGQGIALIVRTIQQAVAMLGLTEDEVAHFAEELNGIDTVAPILDPTTYRDWVYGDRDEVHARTQFVRQLLPLLMRLPIRGEGLIGTHLAPMFQGDTIQGYLVAPVDEEREAGE